MCWNSTFLLKETARKNNMLLYWNGRTLFSSTSNHVEGRSSISLQITAKNGLSILFSQVTLSVFELLKYAIQNAIAPFPFNLEPKTE